MKYLIDINAEAEEKGFRHPAFFVHDDTNLDSVKEFIGKLTLTSIVDAGGYVVLDHFVLHFIVNLKNHYIGSLRVRTDDVLSPILEDEELEAVLGKTMFKLHRGFIGPLTIEQVPLIIRALRLHEKMGWAK